ncbi:hypothetical protein ACN47E_009819 [Coniothyrium glycines]
MSQINNPGAPTPRRSNRLSTKASSVADTAVTNVTTGGTRLRRTGPLTKVKPRKSNAYGASGRVGAAEELSISATGFATAFQNQRGDAFARDDEDEEEDDDDDDDVDELGADISRMSGALNGSAREPSSPPEISSRAAGFSFMESEDITQSEEDLEASIGNTSKSFGPMHEAGMLMSHNNRDLRLSSPQGTSEPTPSYQRTTTRRTFQARTLNAEIPNPAIAQYQNPPSVPRGLMQPPIRPPPVERREIGRAVDQLLAEGQARAARQGNGREARPQQSQGRQNEVNKPHAVNDWLQDVEPHQEDEPEWSLTKVLTWVFWAVLGLAFVVLLGVSMKAHEFPESGPRSPGILTAVGARVSYTMGSIAELIQPPLPPPEMTEDEKKKAFNDGNDNFLWDRMTSINKKLQTRMDNMQATTETLKDHLPPILIVRQHEGGRYEINDEFWHALIDKVQKEDSKEWQEYLKRLHQNLDALYNNRDERSDTDSYAKAVSRQEFIEAVEQKYAEISSRVDEKIAEAFRTQRDQIKAVTETQARKTMIENLRLQSLAQSTLLANYELHLRTPNYYSPGLGAYIDPKLTSSTFGDDPGWLGRIMTSPTMRSPKAALYDWREPGDCWCATPSPGHSDQAQLTVSLGRPVIPKKVTVEHIPMTMMPGRKITNAPRTVELWVQTEKELNYYYSERQVDCSIGMPGWKCLGSFKYNIYAANHVQTFELAAEPSETITKTMLRVVNNWGADHTCLYQVRLHGDDAEKDFDYQVRLNDD